MPEGDVETFYQDGAWRNHVQGSGTSALSFSSRAEAVEAGRDEAIRTRAEHVIKDETGEIEVRTSYVRDPGDVSG